MLFGNGFRNKYVLSMKIKPSKKYYDGFRFIVTTGSILLPAILSMGQMNPNKLPKNFDMISYWASWTISLMVTASNGFLQLFSLDKSVPQDALFFVSLSSRPIILTEVLATSIG